MLKARLSWLAPLVLLTACGAGPREPGVENVLLLIADDVGADRIGAYAEHPEPGRTVHLDALARRGVRFRSAWATPMCSPTRASIVTGRLPSRTGVGAAINALQPAKRAGLDSEGENLPRVVGRLGMTPFAVGKWHLAGGAQPSPKHALLSGFAHHIGYPHNLVGPTAYTEWLEFVDGRGRSARGYIVSAEVDQTLDFVKALPEPWLGHVAFHLAHTPFHRPPDHLHSYDLSGDPNDTPRLHYAAALEALDREIGRLLDALGPDLLARTTIIFVADNGTPNKALLPPHRRGKHSLLEGGIRVPLIIAGPRVAPGQEGSVSGALVHVTDLFATIVEIAGGRSEAEDSISLLPYLADSSRPSERRILFTERFQPNGGPPDPAHHARAVRDRRYKLIDEPRRGRALYDLQADPYETRDLLATQLAPEALAALIELETALETQRASVQDASSLRGRIGPDR